MSGVRYIARASNIAARMIGGEMMIMSGRDSSLYSLNVTASLLWQGADGVTPLADIVERQICGTFDVEPAVALHDAEALVEDLVRHGILESRDSPMPEATTPYEEAPSAI